MNFTSRFLLTQVFHSHDASTRRFRHLGLCALLLAAAGCNNSAPTPTAQLAPAREQQDLDSIKPLTIVQVQQVLGIANSLNGKLPQFKYSDATPISHFAPASQIVNLTRQQIAKRLDTRHQGDWLASQTIVNDALRQQGISGEDLAAMMLQISCGWKLLSTQKPQQEMEAAVDQQIETLSLQLTELQQHDLLKDRLRNEQAKLVTERLRVATIMKFYQRMLASVPAADLELLARYENDLKPIIEASSVLASETPPASDIQPTSYVTP